MKFGSFFRRGDKDADTAAVFRGMLTLALGSGAARLISIAAIPILSRIYSPEDYGVLSVFTALTAILAPLLTLRYLTALPLPRHPGLAMSLMALCLLLIGAGTVLIGGLLWAFRTQILGLFSMEEIAPYWWLLVICLVGTSVYEVMTMWATRQRAYRDIARTQFTQSFFGALTKIGLGLLSIMPLGLLIGQTVSVSAGSGSLVWRAREVFRANLRFVTWRNIGRVASGYRNFPLYRLPSQFLLAFSMQAPLLFTAAMFDTAITGQLGMAITALTMPMSLIGNAIGRAFYAEIARAGRNQPDRIYALSKSTQIRLFLMGIPVGLVIALAGELIFSTLFGEKWQTAGSYASALAPYVMFQLTSAPLMNVLNVFDQQAAFLMINISRVLSLLVLFAVIFWLEAEAFVFVASYSTLMTVFYVTISLYIMNAARRKSREKVRKARQRDS